jgi:hypothetical protein
LQKLDTPVVKSLASMKGKDQIRRVIEDSIEPALKAQASVKRRTPQQAAGHVRAVLY